MIMKKKKTHGVQLLVRAVVQDPDGKIITDTGRKPARSFVIQLLEWLHFQFKDGTTTETATATDGTEDTIYYGDGTFGTQGNHGRIDALVNIDDYGIVVGTGDTAETNTDYKLDTQLTEGVGAGNITHGEQVIEAVAEVGANVDLEVKRSFVNNTGSTITIKEAGLYMKSGRFAAYFCIIRDVLPASVDVPDKCALTVYYTLRTTV